MDQGIHHRLEKVKEAVCDLERIVQNLMGLSQEGVTRGLAHTEGVDTLIGFVDRIEQEAPLAEKRGSDLNAPEGNVPQPSQWSLTGSIVAGDIPDLCQKVRSKAADLDRLNRENVTRALEVSAQTAEISRVESLLHEWLASARQKPTA